MLIWVNQLFKAILSFITYAYKTPVWYVSTILIFALIPATVAVESTLPDEKAKLEESSHKRKVQIEDSERICGIYRQLLSNAQGTMKVYERIMSVFKEIKDSNNFGGRQQQFEEIHTLIVEARKNTAINIATLKGIQFRESVYGEEIRAHEAALLNDVKMLNMLEEMCDYYLNNDAEKLAQQINLLSNALLPFSLEQKTVANQLESARMKLESTLKTYTIEEERVKAQTRTLFYKGLLKYFVIALSIAYVGAVFIQVGKKMKKPQKSIKEAKKIVSKRSRRRKRHK